MKFQLIFEKFLEIFGQGSPRPSAVQANFLDHVTCFLSSTPALALPRTPLPRTPFSRTPSPGPPSPGPPPQTPAGVFGSGQRKKKARNVGSPPQTAPTGTAPTRRIPSAGNSLSSHCWNIYWRSVRGHEKWRYSAHQVTFWTHTCTLG